MVGYRLRSGPDVCLCFAARSAWTILLCYQLEGDEQHESQEGESQDGELRDGEPADPCEGCREELESKLVLSRPASSGVASSGR
jgi:hypothetical protein